MAVWQKVITSGSNAVLNQLNVGTLQNITATGTSTSLSGSFTGSFTGSFSGNGSGLTGVTATAIFPSTERTNVNTSDKFFISQSTGQEYITYGALLTDLAGTNLVTESNDSLTLASTITGLTSISATSFTGSLSGNATTATTATNANNTAITDTTTGTGPYYITFVSTTTGNTGQLVDSTGLTYNATTNVITATASLASTAAQTQGTLTLGNGLTGTSFNGSSNVTAAVGAGSLISVGAGATNVITSSFTANQIPKLSGGGLSGSNITDTGTQIQIVAAASSGLSVAAGGVNVTGNSIFNNNLTVTGDLTVAGTASFTNTDNLTIRDKFILINSGSTTLADSGWVTQYNAAGSGSAFYLEAASAGTYGRYAVAYDIIGTSTSLTPDEYVNTTKIGATTAVPVAAPTWGGATNGIGNMYVTSDGQIFIYA